MTNVTEPGTSLSLCDQKRSRFEYDELIACAKGKLFGPGNAQLPHPPMLMFDRIIAVSDQGGRYDRGSMRAELKVRPDLWFFACHFDKDPVMPGCLGLDALWQMLGFYLAWQGGKGAGRALGAGKIRFTNQILPHNRLIEYQVDIKRIVKLELRLAIADGRLICDGEEVFVANDLRVGLFKR